MNEFLRDRILRKLDTLPDDRLYQVLDYVEFLESKFASRQNPEANVFTRFAESVEDKLRAGRVSASTIAETMGLMNRAMGVLNGAVAAGKSVANDLVSAATRPGTPAAPPSSTAPVTTTKPAVPPSASPSQTVEPPAPANATPPSAAHMPGEPR